MTGLNLPTIGKKHLIELRELIKEFVTAFENVIGKPVNKENDKPRLGDVPGAFANACRAKELIKWKANYSLEDGISDALKWDEIRENIISY